MIKSLTFLSVIANHRLDRASNLGNQRVSGFAKNAAFDIVETNIRESTNFDNIRVWFNNKGSLSNLHCMII